MEPCVGSELKKSRQAAGHDPDLGVIVDRSNALASAVSITTVLASELGGVGGGSKRVAGAGQSIFIAAGGNERLTLRLRSGSKRTLDLPARQGLVVNFPFESAELVEPTTGSNSLPVTRDIVVLASPVAGTFQADSVPSDVWLPFFFAGTAGLFGTPTGALPFPEGFRYRIHNVMVQVGMDANAANRFVRLDLFDGQGVNVRAFVEDHTAFVANDNGFVNFGRGSPLTPGSGLMHSVPMPEYEFNVTSAPTGPQVVIDATNAQAADAVPVVQVSGHLRGITI